MPIAPPREASRLKVSVESEAVSPAQAIVGGASTQARSTATLRSIACLSPIADPIRTARMIRGCPQSTASGSVMGGSTYWGFDVSDVDFTVGVIRLEDGYRAHGGFAGNKGRRTRSAPMSANVGRELWPRCQGKDGEELVFQRRGRPGEPIVDTDLSRRFIKACRRAGLPRIRFHELRHTFGTQAIRSFKIHEVQRMLGHRHVTTTEIYLQYAPDAEGSAKAHRAPGRPRCSRSHAGGCRAVAPRCLRRRDGHPARERVARRAPLLLPGSLVAVDRRARLLGHSLALGTSKPGPAAAKSAVLRGVCREATTGIEPV
jgi:hypothetical protein